MDCSAGNNTSTTFRCGDDLVSVGDTVADVVLRCGEPTYIHKTGSKGKSRATKRKRNKKTQENQDETNISKKKKRTSTRVTYEEKVMETWYYNRGSDDFMYSLYFEGGVLTKIVQGSRGK
jgi:Tfp pilus assembly protein PilX